MQVSGATGSGDDTSPPCTAALASLFRAMASRATRSSDNPAEPEVMDGCPSSEDVMSHIRMRWAVGVRQAWDVSETLSQLLDIIDTECKGRGIVCTQPATANCGVHSAEVFVVSAPRACRQVRAPTYPTSFAENSTHRR